MHTYQDVVARGVVLVALVCDIVKVGELLGKIALVLALL